MTVSNSNDVSRSPGPQNLIAIVRRQFRGRRGLLLLAGLALALGMVLKWNWLVAAGVAPLILSLLPCAAMCALGFCVMHKAVGDAGAPQSSPPETKPGADPQTKS